jgi:hypothetical protein
MSPSPSPNAGRDSRTSAFDHEYIPQWRVDEIYPRKLAYGTAFVNSHCIVDLPHRLHFRRRALIIGMKTLLIRLFVCFDSTSNTAWYRWSLVFISAIRAIADLRRRSSFGWMLPTKPSNIAICTLSLRWSRRISKCSRLCSNVNLMPEHFIKFNVDCGVLMKGFG